MNMKNLEFINEIEIKDRSFDTLMVYKESSDQYGKGILIDLRKDKKGNKYLKFDFLSKDIDGGFDHLFLNLDEKRTLEGIEAFKNMINAFYTEKYEHISVENIDGLYTDINIFGKPKDSYSARVLVVTNEHNKRTYRLDVLGPCTEDKTILEIKKQYYLTNPDIAKLYEFISDNLEED